MPSKAQTGPVEVMIGKKKVQAGTFTVVYPKILSITLRRSSQAIRLRLSGEHFGITAGPRDPNTMFGVNDVVVGNVVVRPRRWKDDKIEVEIPANAASGDIASAWPLPTHCRMVPVARRCNTRSATPSRSKLIPTVQVDPVSGPVGTKVVLFGQGFGQEKKAGETDSRSADIRLPLPSGAIVRLSCTCPLDAETGPMVLSQTGTRANRGGLYRQSSQGHRSHSCQCSYRHAGQDSRRAFWRLFRERSHTVQLYGFQYRAESGGNRWSSRR